MATEHSLNKWVKLFMKGNARQDTLIISSHGGQVEGAAGWEPSHADWKPVFCTENNYGSCTYGSIPSWYTRYQHDELQKFNTGQSSKAGRTPGDYYLTKFQASHKGVNKVAGRSSETYTGILADVAKEGNDFDVLTIRAKDSKKAAVKLSEVYEWLYQGNIGGDLRYPVIVCAFCLVRADHGAYVNVLTNTAYTG